LHNINEIIKKHTDYVFNICFQVLRNREDAEDCTQEAFIEVYKNLGRFEGKSSITTWIYRIALNKAIDMQRKNKSQKRLNWLSKLFGQEPNEDFETPTTNPSPEKILENTELQTAIYNALEQLPESQKKAFILSKIEGLSQKEIAEILQTSESGVESLLVRAKAKLKSLLNKKYFE